MEPLGDYPIRIVVKNGKIALLGVVNSHADKTVAGMRASEVLGSFGVENQLVVEKARSRRIVDARIALRIVPPDDRPRRTLSGYSRAPHLERRLRATWGVAHARG
jgi:hypothetical protein